MADMMKKQGTLLVLIGPSGSGKGTVVKEVLKQDTNTYLSVSATTRKPRPGEEDGVHYLFITKEEFEGLIQTNSMLEYACYCENYYGTPKATVLSRLQNGENVILEIEMQGAKQIKKMYPNAVLVFIIPPSIEVLRERLTNRGTEDAITIQKRMGTALREIDYALECDYIVVNDILEQAVEDVVSIIRANNHTADKYEEFIRNLK